MNKLECLEDEAYNKGIDVVDYNLTVIILKVFMQTA